MQNNQFEQMLLALVEQVISETDNERRASLEDSLNICSSDPQYLGALLQALQNPSISKSCVSYVMILVKKVAEKSHLWSDQEGLTFLNHILFLMSSPAIDPAGKLKFDEILRTALSPPLSFKRSPTIITMRKSLLKNLTSVDFSIHNPKLKDKNQLWCLFLCIKCLAACVSDPYNSSILTELRQVCIQVFNPAIEPLIVSLAGDLFSRTHILSDSSQIACKNILEVIELYARAFLKVSEKIKDYHDSKRNRVEDMAEPMNILHMLLLIKIGNLNISTSNFFFESTPFSDLNTRLSSIHTKTIRSLLIYFKAFSAFPADHFGHSKPYSIIENQLRSAIKIILEALHNYFASSTLNVPTTLQDKTLDRLLQLTLKFLSVACSDFRFFEPFSQTKTQIFRDVILTIIIASETERQNFVDNPNEFVAYSFDFIGDKKSGTLKVAVIKFFDAMCNYIDGMVTHAFNVLIDALRFVIEGSPRSNIEFQYKHLNQITSSAYYLKFSDETKVESALLMLAALSEWVGSRKDLLSVVRQFSLNYGSVFLSENASDLIKSRFMLFTVRYMDSIFDSLNAEQEVAPEMLNKLVEMSYWILAQIEGNDAKSKIGIKCFFLMLKQSKHSTMIEPLFVHLLETFNRILPKTDSLDFLMLVRTFLHKYGNAYMGRCAYIEPLIDGVVDRIITEHRKKTKDSVNFINQCFSIISMVSNTPMLIREHFDIVDKKVSILLSLVVNERPVWEEELIDFYVSSSDNARRFSNAVHEILALASVLHTSSVERISRLFPLFNRMFVYATHAIDNQVVKTVIAIVNTCLSAKTYSKNSEFYLADALLLLQVLIQNAGSLFVDDDVNNCFIIFETQHFRMNMEINKQTIFLRDKILGLFCSILLQFSDLVLQPLVQSHRLSDYIKSVKENLHHFETALETKLLISGMVKIVGFLFKSAESQSQHQVIDLLNWLIPFMQLNEAQSLAQTYTRIRQKRRLKKTEEGVFKIVHELLEFFPEIEIDSEQSFLSEQAFEDELDSTELLKAEGRRRKEKQHLVEHLITSLSTYDEYSELRSLVLRMSESNPEFVPRLMELVNPLCRKYFKAVVYSMQYVSLPDEKQQSMVLRKIVHFKRQ
jgi:hypothetical protein